jgi:hypothetical protein
MIPALIAGGAALAGAVGGGLSAGAEADKNRKYYKSLAKGYGNLQGDVRNLEAQRTGEVDSLYNPYLGDFENNANDYFGALKNTDYSQFNLSDPGEFNFDLQAEIQNQMNPEIEAITGRANQDIQQSAANRGGLFSGATAKSIARSTADITANEWGKARDAAQQERQSKYQQWTDKFDQASRIAEQNRNNLNMGLQNQGTLYGAQSDMFNTANTQKSGIQNAADTSYLNLAGQKMGANAQAKAQPGYWSAFGQGALSGLANSAGGAGDLYGAIK